MFAFKIIIYFIFCHQDYSQWLEFVSTELGTYQASAEVVERARAFPDGPCAFQVPAGGCAVPLCCASRAEANGKLSLGPGAAQGDGGVVRARVLRRAGSWGWLQEMAASRNQPREWEPD